MVRSSRPGPRGSCRRMIGPFTGRTGTASGTPSSWEDQAPAASTTRGAATVSPPASRTPGKRERAARGGGGGGGGRRPAPDLAARPLDGGRERGDELARVGRVVTGHVERQADGRRQRRLGVPGLA